MQVQVAIRTLFTRKHPLKHSGEKLESQTLLAN